MADEANEVRLQFAEAPTKKVALFTTFNEADPAYSLNRVVQDQIKMLLMNGYEPIVFVSQGFKPIEWYAHPKVTIRELPNVAKHNEVKKDPSFEEDVDRIYEALKTVLADVDIVMSQDLVYQPDALKHHFAARRIAAEFPKIRWLHWIHSATSPYTLIKLRRFFSDEYLKVMENPFPNSYYVFFNHYSIPRISENFKIPPEMVRVVYHPIDIAGFFGVDPLVEKLWETKKYYSADAILTYPIRLDRGKQVQFVIKTMAKLKDFNLSPRVTIVDFHSTGGDKVTYRDELKQLAIDCGLNAQEITFTSEFDNDWNTRVPHRVVRDLMLLSNVFILPSVSESYSLITQEQALCGAVTVTNRDFPPFREMFGTAVIERKYSAAIDVMNGMDGFTTTRYGGADISDDERKYHEDKYHQETAGMIANQLLNNPVLVTQSKVRKERNLQAIFKSSLEPLFYG